MPAFYKIAKDRRLVLSTASGVLTLEDVLAHQDQILADPDFNPQYSQLLDLTHAARSCRPEVKKLEALRCFAHERASTHNDVAALQRNGLAAIKLQPNLAVIN
jgi:hypothetical protein